MMEFYVKNNSKMLFLRKRNFLKKEFSF